MDTSRVLRNGLGALLGFAAFNAFAGGFYGMAGAEGVPVEWLAGSPFSDYFFPSLILATVVGGAFLFAAIAVFRGAESARLATFGAVAIVTGWLAVQLAVIGYVSWMQPVTAAAAALMFALALTATRARRA